MIDFLTNTRNLLIAAVVIIAVVAVAVFSCSQQAKADTHPDVQAAISFDGSNVVQSNSDVVVSIDLTTNRPDDPPTGFNLNGVWASGGGSQLDFLYDDRPVRGLRDEPIAWQSSDGVASATVRLGTLHVPENTPEGYFTVSARVKVGDVDVSVDSKRLTVSHSLAHVDTVDHW